VSRSRGVRGPRWARIQFRWILIAVCALLGAALGLYPLTLVEAKIQIVIPGALAAVLLAAAAVGGWARLAGSAALLVVAEYTAALIVGDSGIDISAVVVGAALFLELELLDLSRRFARGATLRRDVVVARGIYAGGVAVAGIMLGAAVMFAGTLTTGGHPLLLAAGAAAALAAAWLVVTLTRRAVAAR
jgi:hypothetical protein